MLYAGKKEKKGARTKTSRVLDDVSDSRVKQSFTFYYLMSNLYTNQTLLVNTNFKVLLSLGSANLFDLEVSSRLLFYSQRSGNFQYSKRRFYFSLEKEGATSRNNLSGRAALWQHKMCFTFIKLCTCCKKGIDTKLTDWNQYSMFNTHMECGLFQNCVSRVYSISVSDVKCLKCFNHSTACNKNEVFQIVIFNNNIESVIDEKQ